MAKDTITFELGGRVDIRRLQEGVTVFRNLITALTANGKVTWVVEDMQPGSAIITLRGEATNQIEVEKVVDGYGGIGSALARQVAMNHDLETSRAVEAVRRLINSVEYVRFETREVEYTIYGNGSSPVQPNATHAIGAITGRVQTLSNRLGLRFNLYDTIHDKAVGCYLEPGQENLMRQAWGRRAKVSGRVSREQSTGRPLSVRQITDIEILGDVPLGDFREARGSVPLRDHDPLPEDAIRRVRDA